MKVYTLLYHNSLDNISQVLGVFSKLEQAKKQRKIMLQELVNTIKEDFGSDTLIEIKEDKASYINSIDIEYEYVIDHLRIQELELDNLAKFIHY